MGAFDDLIPTDTARPSGGIPRITVNPVDPNERTSAFDDLIPKPKTSGTDAFGRGLANTATFNFLDEIEGLARAGGLEPDDPDVANAIKSLFVGAYRKFKGDEDAEKLYKEQVEQSRASTKQMQEQHPGASLAGNITGAVALPLGAALRAPTLLGRMRRGAAVGAGTGGVAGVGEGTDTADRAARGATGTLIGAGVGAVAPPAVEWLVKGVGLAASKPIGMLRAAINPTGAAERAVGRAYNEGVQADPGAVNRLTPQEIVPGGPATVMETMGQPGRNLARSAGNISGQARDVLNQTLDPRFEEQAPRLVNWLRSTFHYPDVHAQEQAIKATAKTVNDPNYARAMRDGRGGIWDQELSDLSEAPIVQDAVKAGIKQAQNKSAPNVSQGAAALQARWMGPNGPTLEFWDLVKRQIDQEINVAKRAGRNEDVADLTSVKNTIVAKLDAAVPSYPTARQGAAAFFGAENALEAGQKFVTENFAAPATRAALAKMPPLERQLFQDGFVDRFAKMLEGIPDRADVVRRIYNSPQAREKIEIALGPQRAKELEAMLRIENVMQQSLRSVQGNSTTAMQLIGAGLAGAGGGGILGFDPTTSGLAAALATAGKKGIDHRVANKVAEMLTSDNPDVLQRAVKMVANNERLMAALRVLDSRAASIGGQQSPKSVLPAIGAGRAEDQEPEVPRPVR